MTIGELRTFLATRDLPDEALVVLSRDAEGNGYSPLLDATVGAYLPANTWSGEFFDEAEVGAGPGQRAICLWPVN